MKWTRTPPSEPGLYYRRALGSPTRLLDVSIGPRGGVIAREMGSYAFGGFVHRAKTEEWAGPIPTPDAPDEEK